MKKNALIIFLFLFTFHYGCEKEIIDPHYPSGDFIATGTFRGDYWPTDEWRRCAPEEVGMQSEDLEDLNEEILILKELHVDIHSVLIVKDGYIVAEQYYSEDFGPDSLHRIYSCTKSLVSALTGIAIEQGYIEGVDSRMIDFFPDRTIENMTQDKEEITLEDLLTMSAGLEWYEMEYPYGDERNTYTEWVSSEDRVQFVLDRPMVASPGEEYSYSTGISHVISSILQEATGIRTDSFGMDRILTPLGIDRFNWPVDSKGIAYGGSGVMLTPRDLAKFGQLYLNQGVWDGNQVVPADWVDVSTQQHIMRKYIPDYYYGYQWWVSDESSYSAVGFAGQWLTIIPEHELVVVFTNNFAQGEDLQWSTPERLLHTYILPSVD